MTPTQRVERWMMNHTYSDPPHCLFVERLRAAGLPDSQIAVFLDTLDGICRECWNNDAGCQCWNDD